MDEKNIPIAGGPSVFVRRPTTVEAMPFEGVGAPSFPALCSWLERCGSELTISEEPEDFGFVGAHRRQIYPGVGCWIVREHDGTLTAIVPSEFASFFEVAERVSILRAAS